jgi:hypothetical protein
MIWAKVLASRKSSEIVVDLPPPPLVQLCCTQALAHGGKYVQIVCALVMNISMVPCDDTMITFYVFHLLTKVDLLHFVNNFHLET